MKKMFVRANNLQSIKSACIFTGYQGYQSSDCCVLGLQLRSLMGRDAFGKVDQEERGNTFHNVNNKLS
jgi:hypothetical protein